MVITPTRALIVTSLSSAIVFRGFWKLHVIIKGRSKNDLGRYAGSNENIVLVRTGIAAVLSCEL
jgi:hypothetical protein